METLPPVNHTAMPFMTTAMAHVVMQDHIECLTTVCPIKRQAKFRLTQTGQMVPASRPKFGI